MENWAALSIPEDQTLSRFDEFRTDSLRKPSSIYVAWLMIALCMVLACFLIVRGMQMAALSPMLVVYYIILAVHVVFRLRAGGKANLLAPDMIFVGFYTLFHLGYVTLYALGVIEFSDKVIWFESSMPKAMFIINLGLVGFLLGYELFVSKKNRLECQPLKAPTALWSVTSIFLVGAGLLLHLACLFMIGIDTIMTYGYVVIANVSRYSSARVEMLFWASTMMGILGTIIYVSSSSLRYGKLFHSKIALALALIFSMLFIIEGDRGYFVQIVMPIVLIRHYFIKKIPIALFSIMFALALAVMAAIAVARTTALDVSKMAKEYEYQRGSGALDWRSPLIETGSSFKIPSIITNEVPKNEPYWMGQSYISAAIRSVPFLDGITRNLGLRGPPSYGASPAQWITYTYKGPEASGMGFSICTEGYLNFGYAGAFFELVFIGMVMRWLTARFSSRPSATWAIIMLGCLGAFFMVTRNHLQNVTSFVTQLLLLAGLLGFFCGNERDEENSESAYSMNGYEPEPGRA